MCWRQREAAAPGGGDGSDEEESPPASDTFLRAPGRCPATILIPEMKTNYKVVSKKQTEKSYLWSG